MAFASVSCGPGRERADLVFINGVEPETLDPALITGQPEGRIANALFEGLTRFDRTGQPVPGVAARWDVSEDGRVYTFHLREDAQWSDGRPVEAADFVNAWRRTLAPETASDYASLLYPLLGARAVNEGREPAETLGATATGPRTLRVELESPTSYFIDLCAFTTFLPVRTDLVEALGPDWIKPGNLVGNGPFNLAAWRLNDRIRLERNPRYWNAGSVSLASIDVLPIGDPNTAINFFVTGEADLMMDKSMIPPGMGDLLRAEPWFHAAPFLGTYFLRFNVTRPPFDDPRVRKAFALVIDRATITGKITRNGERAALSLVPPGCGRGYASPPGLGTDVERARQLLAEAGFPGGKGFPLVDYLYPTLAVEKEIAVELQNMWKAALGVEIALHKQEWKVYLSSLKALDYDIGRSSWVGDYNDPNTFLDLFISGSGNNRTGFADPEYDALIAEAAAETDPAARYRTLARAESRLVEDLAVVAPVYFYVGVQFYHPDRLGGVEPNLLDEHPFQEIFWKRAGGRSPGTTGAQPARLGR